VLKQRVLSARVANAGREFAYSAKPPRRRPPPARRRATTGARRSCAVIALRSRKARVMSLCAQWLRSAKRYLRARRRPARCHRSPACRTTICHAAYLPTAANARRTGMSCEQFSYGASRASQLRGNASIRVMLRSRGARQAECYAPVQSAPEERRGRICLYYRRYVVVASLRVRWRVNRDGSVGVSATARREMQVFATVSIRARLDRHAR